MNQTVKMLFVAGILLALALLGACPAFAQQATLSGRVTDPNGGVVPGVTITATNVKTGIEGATLTNAEGYYVFPSLPPGHYLLSAEMPGFRRLVRSGVKLDVQQVARIDFVLEVGELTQEVNVVASAPLVDASTSSLGQLVDGKQVVDLPLLGRNPYALVTLVPGARVPISHNNLPVDNSSNQMVSINGARGYQNEFLLDGAPNTNTGQAGPTIFPSADAVQEFRVTTNNYSAEYGRAAGGVFNVVTKSGTNEWRGGLYEFLRNDALTAQGIYYGIYLQDDFKVTPRLTLNLGLRYEYESPRTERFNQLANFDFQARPPLEAPGLDLRGGLTFVGVGGRPRAQWKPDRNNLAPRFGFAYGLTPKTILRGGFGVFFAPNFAGAGTGPVPFGLSGFSATTNFVGTRDGVTPANFLRDPYPQGINRPTGNRLGLGTLLGESIGFVDRSNRIPYSEQWNLNVQRELPSHILLEVAYVGSRGVKLYGHRQLNQLPDEFLTLGDRLRDLVPNPFFGQITTGALSGPTVSRGQLLRPFPHFLDVQAANSTWGASTYHAGQVKVERRFASGFSLLASYTFSKLLDDVTGNFFGEALSGQDQFQNWNNLRAERSVSSLDTPQRFVAGYIWELPLGTDKRYLAGGWAGRVLAGWQTQGIVMLASGNVLGVTSTNNTLVRCPQPAARLGWSQSGAGKTQHRSLVQHRGVQSVAAPHVRPRAADDPELARPRHEEFRLLAYQEYANRGACPCPVPRRILQSV